MRYNVLFLHVVRYPWKLYLNLVIFAGFGQACQGMSKVLLNNKATRSQGSVELFCLFVAWSYTSMEATVLCHFIWVWSSMPKVLWHNNSPISLERVVWFCWFLQVVICILLDIHWSYKNMLFWAGIVRHSLSSSQIAR